MRRSKFFFLIINNGTTYSSNMGYNLGNNILGEKKMARSFFFPSRIVDFEESELDSEKFFFLRDQSSKYILLSFIPYIVVIHLQSSGSHKKKNRK